MKKTAKKANEVFDKLFRNKAFSKIFDKYPKEIEGMIESISCKPIINRGIPIIWFLKGMKEIIFLDNKKKEIFEQANSIPLEKRKKIKKVIVLVMTNDKNLLKKYPDFLGEYSGDMHEDFFFTKEDNISYTIVFSPKYKFRETLLLGI